MEELHPFSKRRKRQRQAEIGDDGNRQKNGEKLVLEIQTQISEMRMNSKRLRGRSDKVSLQFPLVPNPSLHSLWRVRNVSFLNANICIKGQIVFSECKLKVTSLVGDLSPFPTL